VAEEPRRSARGYCGKRPIHGIGYGHRDDPQSKPADAAARRIVESAGCHCGPRADRRRGRRRVFSVAAATGAIARARNESRRHARPARTRSDDDRPSCAGALRAIRACSLRGARGPGRAAECYRSHECSCSAAANDTAAEASPRNRPGTRAFFSSCSETYGGSVRRALSMVRRPRVSAETGARLAVFEARFRHCRIWGRGACLLGGRA
jgi:hypothetical protein